MTLKADPSSTHLSEQFYPYGLFMLDTLCARLPLLPWRRNCPNGWFQKVTHYNRRKVLNITADTILGSVVMMHKETDLRVGGDKVAAKWFELSVPKFANRDNSILLQEEDVFQKVKEEILRVVNQVCVLDRTPSQIHLSRIDLVQYVPVPLKITMAAHRSSRHRRFHAPAGQWIGQSLALIGRSRRFRVYDSDLLKKGVSGDYSRCEWQLRNPSLGRDFGRKVLPWNTLTLDECYQAFRRLCLDFECDDVPHANSIYMFLALAEKNDWRHRGIPALDLYLAGKANSSAKKILRRIASLRPEVFQFKWSDYLPPSFDAFSRKNAKYTSGKI